MKNHPVADSAPHRNTKLRALTTQALAADKLASSAKEKARVAKAQVKLARKVLKSARAELQLAKKAAKQAARNAKHSRKALKHCLGKIDKEKRKARTRAIALKGAAAKTKSAGGRPSRVAGNSVRSATRPPK